MRSDSAEAVWRGSKSGIAMADITPQQAFLVAIDSDGCVFDSMELKHKECFIPQFIRCFALQAVSKYAREAAEFVNLYSKSRGTNRFRALVEQLDWLRRRPEVKARGASVPRPEGLADWVGRETKLGHPALEQAVAESDDADLKQALSWSLQVNRSVAEMMHNLPPFPHVRECFDRLATKADMIVCSQTPQAALDSEWTKHGLASFIRVIYGQERGSKPQVLGDAARHYGRDRTLMIGDAPGDYHAAVENDALFFPINPGEEEASWHRLFEEGIDRFVSGTFAGEYQRALLGEFHRLLPDRPPWPVDE
jgi:phosphoglycolate phosphatase-like HAD superfamily hydrolase